MNDKIIDEQHKQMVIESARIGMLAYSLVSLGAPVNRIENVMLDRCKSEEMRQLCKEIVQMAVSEHLGLPRE